MSIQTVEYKFITSRLIGAASSFGSCSNVILDIFTIQKFLYISISNFDIMDLQETTLVRKITIKGG